MDSIWTPGSRRRREQPIVAVRANSDAPAPGRLWPTTIPAVAQVLREGIDLAPGVTFLVGENGSGKSTIVEGIAVAYGLSAEGGSFQSTLALIAVLQRIVDDGGQVLCATHSPVLAAFPGAQILEVGEWGIRPAEWNELELVNHWRSFLQDPPRYLRHLLD